MLSTFTDNAVLSLFSSAAGVVDFFFLRLRRKLKNFDSVSTRRFTTIPAPISVISPSKMFSKSLCLNSLALMLVLCDCLITYSRLTSLTRFWAMSLSSVSVE